MSMTTTHHRPGSARGRRLSALAAAGALVIAGLVLPAAAANAAPVLLSQGKTATASTTESTDYLGAKLAVDGDNGTRWASAATDNQWIQVDLGAKATIERVDLRWESAYGKSYTIQTSDDGTSWTTVATKTNGTGGNESLAVTGAGRYVRLQGVARGTGYGYSLWELQVFGTAGTTPTDPTNPTTCNNDNVALNKTATASSQEGDGTAAKFAVLFRATLSLLQVVGLVGSVGVVPVVPKTWSSHSE